MTAWFTSLSPIAQGTLVVEELIPETVRAGHIDAASLGFMLGFATMMALDNAFA